MDQQFSAMGSKSSHTREQKKRECERDRAEWEGNEVLR